MDWSPRSPPPPDSTIIEQLQLQPPFLSVYTTVFEAERICNAKLEAPDALPPLTIRRLATERVYLRVIGWSYVFALRPECHSALSRWITACENDTTAIVHLGRYLCNSYLRLLPYPSDSQSSSSHDSFDLNCESESAEMSSSRNQTEAKQRALERDNYQCVLTKRFSYCSPLYAMPTNPSAQKAIIDAATAFPRDMTREAVEQEPIIANDCVHVAHILGDVFKRDYGSPRTDDEENQKQALPSSPWDLLAAFGYPEIREELEGPRLHRLENLFSVTTSPQIWLESMRVWIEPVGHNKYQIDGVLPHKLFIGSRLYSADGIVEFLSRRTYSYEEAQAQPSPLEASVQSFTSESSAQILSSEPSAQPSSSKSPQYPLPFPKYFELRAAACKVANLSGAVDLFERVETALEEANTLAEDGSHADVLEARLLQVAMTRTRRSRRSPCPAV
ncbi:uncharacterized protein SCHCODRAFT_02683870 [Schizophyllum commune H4-8]|uniref:uncharacterized protein n=1 Tax=Schizophyllum commune (strain H4-8 / FGSC 9210) TaxID=578458 RepID=UPI00215FFAD4|nr:uncharacterized protein SCHCODRAFT_02683870 [Schizophyllum commune H4-8]KAI5897556.1 hypothetical protein SCHCODRAFT_02683870 [Schizophyllum commune H4-8]